MNRKERPLLRSFSPDAVRKSYLKVAWFYDLWAKLTESRATQRVLELAAVRDRDRVLEVAVGTGVVFENIVKRNPHGLNEGLDLSPSMLRRAQKRLERYGPASYHLRLASAYQLPFADNSFDLVINAFMLDLLPEADFPLILAEMKRVLKPSGRVVLSTMSFGDRWYHAFWFRIARSFPALLTGCRPVSIGQVLRAGGFQNVVVERISQNTFPAEVLTAVKP
jgi:ubiquinone/menaquinone biosynthesis C-methylase UbiE